MKFYDFYEPQPPARCFIPNNGELLERLEELKTKFNNLSIQGGPA